MRLIESISDHFHGLRVVVTRYTRAYLPIIISLHFQFQRSEPSSLLNSGVQSHHRFSVLAFRAIISSQFQCSEPSSLPSSGVQSRHRFSVPAFRAIIASQFRHSESSSLLSSDIQSHHRFSIPAFRAIIASQFWRSKPSSLLHFSVQSHRLSLVRHSESSSSLCSRAFRAITFPHVGI